MPTPRRLIPTDKGLIYMKEEVSVITNDGIREASENLQRSVGRWVVELFLLLLLLLGATNSFIWQPFDLPTIHSIRHKLLSSMKKRGMTHLQEKRKLCMREQPNTNSLRQRWPGKVIVRPNCIVPNRNSSMVQFNPTACISIIPTMLWNARCEDL